MEKFIIKGGRRLEGEVEISGAKNAVAAIIPAVILSDEPCVLENIPDISDVSISLRILYEMGAKVVFLNKTTVRIDATGIDDRKIRQSKSFNARRLLLGRPSHRPAP